MLLNDERIFLRAMEPEDCELLYQWENDTSLWSVSGSSHPFSHEAIREFIIGSSWDIYTAKQMRMMIVLKDNSEAIGCIDLFEFNPLENRAGVGILIYNPDHRKNGYASAALELLKEYAFDYLNLKQLWADVPIRNEASIRLFRNAGFTGECIKKAWVNHGLEDALFLQIFSH